MEPVQAVHLMLGEAAIANMTAVTHQYGNAHRAMIVVSLVCGFLIDLVNALIINGFVTLFSG